MAKLSDLKWENRIFMQTYRYRQFDWHPGAILQKPVSQSWIAVVTTAAFSRPDQAPFDASIRGGDYSYREIPLTTDLSTLRIGHKSVAFDHSGIETDKNLALPLDRLREFKAEGRIGDVAPRHYSLMGSISAPVRLVNITSPEIAHRLSEDKTDGVLLTPVWPLCHQSVGLVQSVIEKSGIPTVSISLLREVTERVSPPRALVVDRPLGYPLGASHDAGLQKRIVMAALELLANSVRESLLVDLPQGVWIRSRAPPAPSSCSA